MKTKKLNRIILKKLQKNRKNIELFASIITIFSIFVALGTFLFNNHKENVQELDFQEALIEELINEIDFNLNYISGLEFNKEKFLKTFETPGIDSQLLFYKKL